MLTRYISSPLLVFRGTSFARDKPRYEVITMTNPLLSSLSPRQSDTICLDSHTKHYHWRAWMSSLRSSVQGMVHGFSPAGKLKISVSHACRSQHGTNAMCIANHERLGLFLHCIGTCGLRGIHGNLLAKPYCPRSSNGNPDPASHLAYNPVTRL
jgi:hypothetical protein